MTDKIGLLEKQVSTLREQVSESTEDPDYKPKAITNRPGFDDENMFKPQEDESDTYSYSGASDISATEVRELRSSCEMVFSPRVDYYRKIARL